MTEGIVDVLAIKDGDGGYYLLTRDLLDQVRVRPEHLAEVQQTIERDADDVSGFITPIPIPGKLNFQLLGAFQLPVSLTNQGQQSFEGGGGLRVGFDPGGGI